MEGLPCQLLNGVPWPATARLERRGIVRLEVQVHEQDVPLVLGVVGALADPAREAEMRALLRARFALPPSVDPKALLAAAPLGWD